MHLRNKLIAALKGASIGSIPTAALNILSTGVGTAILEGKDHVGNALKASGATAGVVLVADLAITTGVVLASHYSGLDDHMYRNKSPEEMLSQKTKISGIASAAAGMGVTGLLTSPLGNAMTHQPVTLETFKQDSLNQLAGTAVVDSVMAASGLAAWLYKQRKPRDEANNE